MNEIIRIITKYRKRALRVHADHLNPRPGHKPAPREVADYYLNAARALEALVDVEEEP